MMIRDFIEANGLGARVITFDSDTGFESALRKASLSGSCAAKTNVFSDERKFFLIVISSFGEKVSLGEAADLVKGKVFEIGEKEVLLRSGFEKKYFPPVGVFGSKIFFHPSVAQRKTLVFCLNLREYLVISKEDIIKSADASDSLI